MEGEMIPNEWFLELIPINGPQAMNKLIFVQNLLIQRPCPFPLTHIVHAELEPGLEGR